MICDKKRFITWVFDLRKILSYVGDEGKQNK